jgi:hypothetical protein
MSGHVLSDKSVNTHNQQMDASAGNGKANLKSMDYHRQVLQKKMEQEK